jgi:hypothetical protein
MTVHETLLWLLGPSTGAAASNPLSAISASPKRVRRIVDVTSLKWNVRAPPIAANAPCTLLICRLRMTVATAVALATDGSPMRLRPCSNDLTGANPSVRPAVSLGLGWALRPQLAWTGRATYRTGRAQTDTLPPPSWRVLKVLARGPAGWRHRPTRTRVATCRRGGDQADGSAEAHPRARPE